MDKKFFGTDGIRGEVGSYPITPEFMLKLGWAAGRVFGRQGKGRLLIGKDTRISGYMFESALEAGLSAAGVDVALLGPMPTPAIAYLTRTFNASAGIVISASHNPYYDNGIKFFGGNGEKLPDDIELEIEKQLDLKMETVASNRIGKVSRINDAAGRYIEFCKSCFPNGYNLKGLRLVVDCANGATYHIAPNVFRELGAEVIELAVNPDGLNINHNVGSTLPELLQKKVLEARADAGIALDGDGDRLIMVDHQGELVDGDELLLIIALARRAAEQFNGGVVGTVMSNFGLEVALQRAEIPFVRAKVGDRFVVAELNARGWSLGGESSGHLLCKDLTTTGDGIISALQVLAAMTADQKPLHELKQQMTKYPQIMINVRHQGNCDLDAGEISEGVARAERKLGGKGRVLLRPSGTEPLVRVMVEGEDASLVEVLAQDLADTVKTVVAE